MRLKNFDDGLKMLRTVRDSARQAGENDFVKEAYVEEIKYNITKEDYVAAIKTAEDFIKISDDDVTNAEVEYELGKLYQQIGEPNNAITAFNKVFDYSPSYDIEFLANLARGRALRQADKNEEALNVFENMNSEDKYADSLNIIDLEMGITLLKMNNLDDAVEQLTVADTMYTGKPSSGIAKFELGKIFEKYYKDYDSARVYYELAAGSTAPIDYIKEARDKVGLFKKYSNLHNTLESSRKQIFYLENPDEFVKDSIAYYEKAKADSAELNNPFAKKDTAEQSQETFGRRRGAFTQNSAKTPLQQPKETEKPPVRPTASVDSLEENLVKSEYELGNLFFTEFNYPDSAYYYYKDILQTYPNSPYEARTLYSLGSYYLTVNDSAKADSLFLIIYNNYKNEKIVNAAANKLNKPVVDLEYDQAKDLYEKAESQFLNNNYDASLDKFYNIYKNYPASSYAPKALYATGWILENEMDLPDSAAKVYDSVVTKFPKTVYASKVLPKIQYYKQEKIRRKKAFEDSIKLVRQQIADSVAYVDSLKKLMNPVKTDSSITKKGAKIDTSKIGNNKKTVNEDSTRRNLENNILNADSSVIKTGKNSIYVDSAANIQRAPQKNPLLEQQKNKTREDSLNLEHQTIIDSLRRSRTRGQDSTQQQLQETIDSLNARKPIRPPGGK